MLTRLAGPRPELERRGVVRGVLIALEGVCFAVERGVAVAMRLGRCAMSGDIAELSGPDALLVELRATRFAFAMLSFDGGGVGRGDTRGLEMRDGEADTRGPVPPTVRALPLFVALFPGVPRCGEHRAALVVDATFCRPMSPRRTAATPFIRSL